MVIKFKAKFLAHIMMLKCKGEKFTYMFMLENWISDKIDKHY